MFTEPHPHFLRRTFLTGLLILLPLFVTYVLIAFLFNLFTGVGAPLVRTVLRVLGPDRYVWAGPLIPLVNLILSLIVIFLLGARWHKYLRPPGARGLRGTAPAPAPYATRPLE